MNIEQKLENYCGSYPIKHEAKSDDGAEFGAKRIRRWLKAELKDLPRKSTVLDVGCGQVSFTRLLANFSSDVTAFHDSASQVARNARLYPEITFLQHDMSDPIPFPDGSFNVIWCSGILEHVPNPGFALREMYRGLAPGGRLLVTVPYNSRLRDFFVALFNSNQDFISANACLHFFTKDSLEKIAANAGFTSAHLKTCSGYSRLQDFIVPTNILLKAEKSLFAPFSVTFNRYRRDQSQARIPSLVPMQVATRR